MSSEGLFGIFCIKNPALKPLRPTLLIGWVGDEVQQRQKTKKRGFPSLWMSCLALQILYKRICCRLKLDSTYKLHISDMNECRLNAGGSFESLFLSVCQFFHQDHFKTALNLLSNPFQSIPSHQNSKLHKKCSHSILSVSVKSVQNIFTRSDFPPPRMIGNLVFPTICPPFSSTDRHHSAVISHSV